MLAEFVCNRPHLMAIVAELGPQTEGEYQSTLAFARRVRNDTPLSDPLERSEPNEHGYPCTLIIGEAQSGKGPYMFGFSITRIRGKAIVMIFEGHYRMMSETGKAQEVSAFRAQAKLFLTSVR